MKRGFSLFELLTVIVIAFIVLGFSCSVYARMMNKHPAASAQLLSMLSLARSTALSQPVDTGVLYPSDGSQPSFVETNTYLHILPDHIEVCSQAGDGPIKIIRTATMNGGSILALDPPHGTGLTPKDDQGFIAIRFNRNGSTAGCASVKMFVTEFSMELPMAFEMV